MDTQVIAALVQLDEPCEECDGDYVVAYRDVDVYDPNNNLLCNTGYYAKEETPEKQCLCHGYTEMYLYMRHELPDSVLDQALAAIGIKYSFSFTDFSLPEKIGSYKYSSKCIACRSNIYVTVFFEGYGKPPLIEFNCTDCNASRNMKPAVTH